MPAMPRKVLRLEMLAEEQGAEEDGAHRHQEGDEQEVDGAGGRQQAVVDDVGERARDGGEAEERAPDAEGRHGEGPGPVDEQRERHQDDGRRGELSGGGDHRRQAGAAEAPAIDAGEGVEHRGGKQASSASTSSVAPASASGPIMTTTPRKPMITPMTRCGLIFSSTVMKLATMTPKSGVVALRIAARPLATWLWLQTMRLKGMTLLRMPMVNSAAQVLRSRGMRAPVSRITR